MNFGGFFRSVPRLPYRVVRGQNIGTERVGMYDAGRGRERRSGGRVALLRQAVFLDRDGTLNRSAVRDGKPFAPTRLEDFRVLPGVPEAVARLRAAGYLAIVVTNQPDIATGKNSWEVLNAMHARLAAEVGVDDIFVCPHTDADGCGCRKPKPGLILAAAAKWGIDPRRSVMVGDRWSDIAAGRAAGCRTVFIDRGYTKDKTATGADLTVASLAVASDAICALAAGLTP